MTRPGPSVSSSGVIYPGADSLSPTGFGTGTGGVRASSVGTTEITDGGIEPVDIDLPALKVNLNATYGQVWATPAASTTLTGTLAAWTVTAVDCTAGAGARSLPAANSVTAGASCCAKKADTSGNALTVNRAGSDLIFGTGSGATSKVLTLAGEAVEFVSNGVDRWTVRASDTPSGVLSATYGRHRPAVKVGGLGDSITASLSVNNRSGGHTYEFSDAPLAYAYMASDGRWDYVVNAGVGGERSDQIAARLQSDVIAAGCNVCVIGSGFWNSIGQARSDANTVADYVGMIAACRAAGVVPVVVLPTPDGRTGSTTGRIASMENITRLLRSYCSQNMVAIVDAASALVDPATGTISTTYNNDGSVHPTPAGFQQIGLAIQKTLDGLIPPGATDLVRHAADPTDLLGGKGLFLSNTGGVGTSWTYTAATSGSTASIVTDGAVLGSLQQIAGVSQVGNAFTDSANFTGWSVGDWLEMRGVMTTAGGTAFPRVRFVVGGAPNPNTFPTVEPKAAVTRGQFRVVWQVPTGSTTIKVRIQLQAGTGSMAVGQLSVRNLTALGVTQP